MKNIYKSFIVILALAVGASFATPALAQMVGQVSVQTNQATNVSSYQATLNGYLGIPYLSSSNNVYFQWGSTTGYGSQTVQQYLNNGGSFNQVISGLTASTTYHFRAVAQGSFGTVYGQDMTFYTTQQGNYYPGNNTVLIADNYFTPSNIYINVGDTVVWVNNSQIQHNVVSDNSFELNSGTLYTGGTYSHTFTTPGIFPYHCAIHPQMTGTVTVGGYYEGPYPNPYPIYGNVQTKSATNISSDQANLQGYTPPNAYGTNYVYFQWGTTTGYGNQTAPQYKSGSFDQYIVNLTPNTLYHFRAVAQGSFGTVYGQDMTLLTFHAPGQPQPVSPQTPIIITQPLVYGASIIPTGLTNNFLTDSFLIPLLLIILAAWLYFSGNAGLLANKLKAKFKR